MKLLIIRHGDPDYSIDSLTPTGWKEAELLADKWEKLDVKAFYVSPLGRARDTANVTLRRMNRTAETLPWLREFGPTVVKPGHDQPDCVWDWLPAVWTENPAFYDHEKWVQDPFFVENGVPEALKEQCRSRLPANLRQVLKTFGKQIDSQI